MLPDLVRERNARVNEALCGWHGQVWSQQECFAIPDVLAAILCGLPFTLDLTDHSVHSAAVEIGSLHDEGKAVLASRRRDFEYAAGVPDHPASLESTGDAARTAQPESDRAGVHRVSDQLASVHKYSMSITNGQSIKGTTGSAPVLKNASCIRTVSKLALSSRTCCFPRKSRWSDVGAERITTVSKPHLLRLLSLLIERKADSPTC